MKKPRTLLMVFLSVLLIIPAGACSSKSETVFMSDSARMVRDVRKASSERITFCFIYKGKFPEIKLAGVDGENLSGLSYSMETASTSFKKASVNGYQLGYCYLDVSGLSQKDEQTIKISKILLNVDSESKEIVFDEPLTMYKGTENTNGGQVSPGMIQVLAGEGMPITFSYNINEDMEILSFDPGVLFELENMSITLEGRGDSLCPAEFPFKANAGQVLKISGTITCSPFKTYMFVFSNSCLKYRCGEETYEEKFNLQLYGAGDAETVKQAVAEALEWQGGK